MKQIHLKELEDKEEELEDIRQSCQMWIGHRDFDEEKCLRRDLKRTHALLANLQLLLASMGDSGPSVDHGELEKVHIQLEESETEVLKCQKSLSIELDSLHMELENLSRNKNMADEREKTELLKRNDEDLNELMKKKKPSSEEVHLIVVESSQSTLGIIVHVLRCPYMARSTCLARTPKEQIWAKFGQPYAELNQTDQICITY
ncbi:hypothetical protein XELAEV_18010418mg [Xenopus laevis]|uniref:Uncharacterized protein n=1 Tax=Xenopus laevis TaxID=8355 RepID=A0A974DUH4_XENLA|nr:hypothetical protein XELAEV_18010418mg [Xenopus laevis]